MIRPLLATILFLALAPTVCAAPAALSIDWLDLVPEEHRNEDSLAGLSEEDRGFVEWIIYLRMYLPEEIDPQNQEFYDEMNEAIPELKQRGIDVDDIIAARQARDNAVNEELDGRQVRLSGYLLPLDLQGEMVSEFLLVPWVGACIHTPPPPPNQIVYASFDEAVKYRLEELFKPVTVTGVMAVRATSKNLFLVDGAADIDSGYTLQATAIEDFTPKEGG